MAEADVKLKNFKGIFSLDGKVAVVTGGSRGLGLHAASGLMQSGCSKVIITSRKASACAAACAALNALPNKQPGAVAVAIPADLARVSEIERLARELVQHTAHVDILFANAGATWGEPFESHPEAAFAKVLDLNVKSVFFTVQKLLPFLQRRATHEAPSRVIVNGSVAALTVGSPLTAYGYAASKAAVVHLARALAVELGPRHLLVNAICPGFFPSKMTAGLLGVQKKGPGGGGGGGKFDGGAEEMQTSVGDALARNSPNGRLGEPEDLAAAVVYLASRAGGHVNGATLVLDGGMMWQPSRL